MEDVLSLLKSYTEPWLSFSSEYLDAVPSFILLNVVGLLLLLLFYLLLPTKHPGRATTKRKGGTFRGWRSNKKEEEERKKLFNILKRPLGHHHDSTHFRHMLCPDPSCEVCNRTTAEIQQLLSPESLQDAALSEYFSSSADSVIETSVCLSSDLSTIPPGDATAFPLAEPSPPPCSPVSTNLDTSCEDFISPSNLGDSLPPELTPCLDFSFPGRHVLLQPPGIPTPPPKTKDIHSTNLAALEIWNQAHTKDLPTSNLAQGDAKKNILALHSSKASSGVAPASQLPAPNLSLLSQSCKAHIPVSILPGEFSLNSEIREKLEHHLQKRLVQYQCGLPRRVCESLSLVSIQSDISGTSESKSNQGLSGICLFKDQSIRDTVDLKLSPPGSFCEKILGMLLPEKGERMTSLPGNNSRTSWMSLNQQKCKNALETHLKRKVMEIKENHIPRIVYNSLHSLKHSWASEKPCGQEHQDLAKVISVASNIDTSCQLAFLGPSKQKMLENHIQNYHDRITRGLPEKVLEITELFKMKENSPPGVSSWWPCTQSSMFLHGDKVRRISVPSSDRHFCATSPICKPFREGSVALHEDKARTRTSVPSLNRHFSATSAVCKRYKGDSTALHGDKARTRTSVSSPGRHFSATSPICKPYRESSMALHGDKARTRIPVSSPDRHVSATSPICKPYRERSMALHGDKARTRMSVSSPDQHVSATSPMCKPYRESSMALHEDKARTGTSVPSLNHHFSATSAVCKRYKGDSTALHEDKNRTRMPVPGVDHPFHVTSAVHKHSNKGGPIALHGDKERAIISVPGVDYHLPSTSLVIKVRQGVPRQTPCDSLPEQEDNIKKFNDPEQHSLPCTDSITEKAWHEQSELANRCSPMVFTKQFMAGSKPCYNKWSSRSRIKRLQGKKLNNFEHFPMPNKSRKIFISRELCALPSPHRSILTTNKSEISPMTDVSLSLSNIGNTINIKCHPPIVSESTDTKLSGLSELKVILKNRECNQEYKYPTDQTLASRNLKSKPVLTHAQGICTWDTAPSHVLHVHIDNTGSSRQQMQEPCVPLCGLWKGQEERVLPAVKRTNPPEPKAEELGGGDAGLGPSQPRRRIHAARDEVPKDTCGKTSSPVQSQRGQLPAESRFRKRVKHFLQWIWPSRKCDGPESFLKNGRSLLSMQGINLDKNQATFTWDTKLQQVRSGGGNVPGEKWGHDHGIGKKCHQESLSSQMKSGKTQHKAELQIGAVPVQGCPFNHRATSCKVTNTTSCHQGAALAGQSYPTRNVHERPRGRGPQKTVLFKDQHGTRSIP